MNVYLAGPMRGYERWNFPAFDAAKKDIEERTVWKVTSPADLDRSIGFDEFSTEPVGAEFLREAARRDCDAICKSQGMVLLPGWEKSSGVTGFELPLARFLNVPVYLYPSLDAFYGEEKSADNRLEDIKRERQQIYGDPKENHDGISMMWAPLLQPHWKAIRDGVAVPAHVVALLMCTLKLNRMRLRFSQDNYDDLRNYLSFAEEWQQETPE